MDSIYSWLDATAVRSLADRLMDPDLEPSSMAAAPDVIPHVLSEPPTPEISRFRDWMRETYSASGIFILDHQGTVIFDESLHNRWHFVSQKAALVSHHPGSVASFRMKISATATLEIISASTDGGGRAVGAVVSAPLDPAAVAAVQTELRRMATP